MLIFVDIFSCFGTGFWWGISTTIRRVRGKLRSRFLDDGISGQYAIVSRSERQVPAYFRKDIWYMNRAVRSMANENNESLHKWAAKSAFTRGGSRPSQNGSPVIQPRKCGRFSLHHYVTWPFMESVDHVLSEITRSSSCFCDRVGAICFCLFFDRYKSGGEPKMPKRPP